MPHRSTLRGRVWKLTDLWTQRTRPQILAKPQNGFAQAPTRLIAILFHKNPKTRTPLGFSGQLPTDSAEEADIHSWVARSNAATLRSTTSAAHCFVSSASSAPHMLSDKPQEPKSKMATT